MASKFITLHNKLDNSLIGINVDDIVCVSYSPNKQVTLVYMDWHVSEKDAFLVNEKLQVIVKKIDDDSNYIIIHSKTSNNEVLIAKDGIQTIIDNPRGGCVIKLTFDTFAEITVNESTTSVVDMINR